MSILNIILLLFPGLIVFAVSGRLRAVQYNKHYLTAFVYYCIDTFLLLVGFYLFSMIIKGYTTISFFPYFLTNVMYTTFQNNVVFKYMAILLGESVLLGMIERWIIGCWHQRKMKE